MSTQISRRKSRHGCLRCKTKKVKCDERKPACSRCESDGVDCPGYFLNVRWSQKHQWPGLPSSTLQRRQEIPGRRTERSLNRPSTVSEMPVMNTIEKQIANTARPFMHLELPTSLQNSAQEYVTNILDQTSLQAIPPPNRSFDATMDHNVLFDIPQDLFDSIEEDNFLVEDFPLVNLTAPPAPQPEPNDSTHLSDEFFPILIPDLLHLPSALTNHFFKDVIKSYCTWDNSFNSLRIMVEPMWQSSGALYHTIQSMAAICLSPNFPHLAQAAYGERFQALQYLQQDFSPNMSLREKILATFLLGHTSSWFDPTDLAIDKFHEVRGMTLSRFPSMKNDPEWSFLEESLDFWTMLLSFSEDIGRGSTVFQQTCVSPVRTIDTATPHAWNGICREIVRLITDVGRVTYTMKKGLPASSIVHENNTRSFNDALQEAQRLEERLLTFWPTDTSRMIDTGDPRTMPEHFRLMEEVFQYTGLIQLYRMFPELLIKRYRPWNKNDFLLPLQPSKIPTIEERNSWLTSLALHVVHLLQQIPFESLTRCIQPFIMVAVSSELRCNIQVDGTYCINNTSVEVALARNFIRSRLSAYAQILPLRKAQQHCQLVEDIWSAIDAGEDDVYWVDVAHKKKLGTMMA